MEDSIPQAPVSPSRQLYNNSLIAESASPSSTRGVFQNRQANVEELFYRLQIAEEQARLAKKKAKSIGDENRALKETCKWQRAVIENLSERSTHLTTPLAHSKDRIDSIAFSTPYRSITPRSTESDLAGIDIDDNTAVSISFDEFLAEFPVSSLDVQSMQGVDTQGVQYLSERNTIPHLKRGQPWTAGGSGDSGYWTDLPKKIPEQLDLDTSTKSWPCLDTPRGVYVAINEPDQVPSQKHMQGAHGRLVPKMKKVKENLVKPVDSGDEAGKAARPPKRQRTSALSKIPDREFACPYFIRYPVEHMGSRLCYGSGFPDICRLMLHLYKNHRAAAMCSRCGGVFDEKEDPLAHRASKNCIGSKAAKVIIHAFDETQARLLQKGTFRIITEREKWFTIYRILFPSDEVVASPYFDQPHPGALKESGLASLVDFIRAYEYKWRFELPLITQKKLEKLIDEELISMSKSSNSLVLEHVRRAQAKLFDSSEDLVQTQIKRAEPTETKVQAFKVEPNGPLQPIRLDVSGQNSTIPSPVFSEAAESGDHSRELRGDQSIGGRVANDSSYASGPIGHEIETVSKAFPVDPSLPSQLNRNRASSKVAESLKYFDIIPNFDGLKIGDEDSVIYSITSVLPHFLATSDSKIPKNPYSDNFGLADGKVKAHVSHEHLANAPIIGRPASIENSAFNPRIDTIKSSKDIKPEPTCVPKGSLHPLEPSDILPTPLEGALKYGGRSDGTRNQSAGQSDATNEYWNLEDISDDDIFEEPHYDPAEVHGIINDRIIDYLMLQACHAVAKKCPKNQDAEGPSKFSAPDEGQKASSQKQFLKHGIGREDGQEEEDKEQRKKRPKLEGPDGANFLGQSERLACPFFQRSPLKYQNEVCTGPGFDNLKKLKEHLKRRHLMPLHCRRCWTTFETESNVETHVNAAERCLQRPEHVLEGVTDRQWIKMSGRCLFTHKQTIEEQWRIVYRLLFPEDIEVPSPYYQYYSNTIFDHPVPASPSRSPDFNWFFSIEHPRLLHQRFRIILETTPEQVTPGFESQLLRLYQECAEQASRNYEIICNGSAGHAGQHLGSSHELVGGPQTDETTSSAQRSPEESTPSMTTGTSTSSTEGKHSEETSNRSLGSVSDHCPLPENPGSVERRVLLDLLSHPGSDHESNTRDSLDQTSNPLEQILPQRNRGNTFSTPIPTPLPTLQSGSDGMHAPAVSFVLQNPLVVEAEEEPNFDFDQLFQTQKYPAMNFSFENDNNHFDEAAFGLFE